MKHEEAGLRVGLVHGTIVLVHRGVVLLDCDRFPHLNYHDQVCVHYSEKQSFRFLVLDVAQYHNIFVSRPAVPPLCQRS